MRYRHLGLVGLLSLSACSIGPRTSETIPPGASCEAIGFTRGTGAYEQCEENQRIRVLVNQRKLFNTNNNQPLGMLVQQYGKPMSPLLNCTSYHVGVVGAPTLCD